MKDRGTAASDEGDSHEELPLEDAAGTRRGVTLFATVVVALAVILLIAVDSGVRSFAELGRRPPASVNPTPAANASPSPTPEIPPLELMVTFDLLPVGPLTVEAPVGSVVGTPEVVAFPSPLDRSLLLAGATVQGVCWAAEGLRRAALSVTFEAYQRGRSGDLTLTLHPATGMPVALDLRGAAMDELDAGQWHRLSLEWDGDMAGSVEVGDGEATATTDALPLVSGDPVAAPMPEAICLTTSNANDTTELIIDNVLLEQ